MRLITAVAISLLLVIRTSAQYLDASSDPVFAFSGDWVQLVDGDYSVMESSTIGDAVSIEFAGSSVIIYRELLTAGAALVEICLDGVCSTISNTSVSADQQRVPVSFATTGASPHTMTLTNVDGGTFRLSAVLVLPDDELLSNSAPAPSVQYLTLESGRVVAVDFSATAGDIALFIVLAFLAGVNLYSLLLQRTQNDE